jgi:hypothetical protein
MYAPNTENLIFGTFLGHIHIRDTDTTVPPNQYQPFILCQGSVNQNADNHKTHNSTAKYLLWYNK